MLDQASEIRDHLVSSREALDAALADRGFLETAVDIAKCLEAALRRGHKILLAGNGGSAGDAQHIAGEFLCRLNYDRAPIAAIALTTDSSVLTAIANDYGYDHVFERQVMGLGRPDDVLLAISTSGESRNVLAAVSAARQMGLTVIGLTGQHGGKLAPMCDLSLRVPSNSTPLIQQLHITIAHAVCGLVEAALFPRNAC
jgi:D-sedoheptulose 7-phosphate isomerase